MKFLIFLLLAAVAAANPLVLLSGDADTGGGDVTAPTLDSATVNGDQLTLNWSEAVTGSSTYLSALDVDLSTTGSDIAVSSHDSGNGTATWVLTLASAAVNGETADLDFAGGSDLIEDAAGNDLAAIASSVVTNSTPGASYLLEETFEGPGFVASWTESSSGAWEDQAATSPAPLAGSYSLQGQPGDGTLRHTLASETSGTFWVKLTVHLVENTDIGGQHVIRGYNSNGTANNDVVWFLETTDGAFDRWRINQGYTSGQGSISSSGVGTASSGTTRYLWIQNIPETGEGNADGIIRLWVETSDSRSDPPDIEITNGGRVDGMRMLEIRDPNADLTACYFDDIIVSTTEP